MRIYKPVYTRPIPENAERFSRKGVKYIRFTDSRGHVKTGRQTKDGKQILIEFEHWHVSFKDNLCIKRDVKCFSDEQATRRLADTIQSLLNAQANNQLLDNELQKRIETIPVRIRDKFIEYNLLDRERSVAGCPLVELLKVFRQSLIDKDRDPSYVKEKISQLRQIFGGCDFTYWSDISASRLADYLNERRDSGNGFSKRRYNVYLQTAKQFCKWAVKERIVTTSPIEHLEPLDKPQTDRRHERRVLETDKLRRLLETTAQGPERFGMGGYERSLLYRFAIESGLRANEIRMLKVSSFDFPRLTVTVNVKTSKRRREDVLPLRAGTARELQNFFESKLPTAKAFGGSNELMTDKTADMMKADLADAKIPYEDESGRFFDFHSLRHQCGSLLADAGVHPKMAQELMRHSDVNLTMNIYSHVLKGRKSEAIESLPDLTLPSKENQSNLKTGTDDLNVTGSDAVAARMFKTSFSNGQNGTNQDIVGQKNLDSGSKTRLSDNNEGANRILNPISH